MKRLLTVLFVIAMMGLVYQSQAQEQPSPTPTPASVSNTEFKITHLGTDVFVVGGKRSAPLFTQEIGGYFKSGDWKISDFSFADFTPRKARTLDIQSNAQLVSYAKFPAVRFMAEETRLARWTVRIGPSVEMNKVPAVGRASGKVFKSLSVAWLKGVVHEPSSQVKITYITKAANWHGSWEVIGFVRLKFGKPNVWQPGINYSRASWHGVSLRLEYNRDSTGQRFNFGPSFNLLKLFSK